MAANKTSPRKLRQNACVTGKQRATTAERTIWSGVSPCAHLDPFLRLLKRGVCSRLGRRVMLMRRSDACNRTCHWRGGSALQLLKPLETCACVIFFKGGGSSVPRYSDKTSRQPTRSARYPATNVGLWVLQQPQQHRRGERTSSCSPVAAPVGRLRAATATVKPAGVTRRASGWVIQK